MSLINHKGTIISQDAGQAQVLIERADSCNSCNHKEHCAVFNHKQPAFLDYVLNFTAKLHSRKAYKIQNEFHIKQNANTHPHALPVLFLTISIPYIAINVVTISMIPQKEVLNG